MKILTSLFASALFATSLFATSAYAINDSQMVDEQQIVHMGGGRYYECFLADDPGCKKQDGR